MDYVNAFIEFATEHWPEITAVAAVLAGLSVALARKWNQVEK
jgi:hypothetical protein